MINGSLKLTHDINFQHLTILYHNVEAARIKFQELIGSLIHIKFKDAHSIRPCPGDWGIDVYVGELTDACFIWQAKFFPDGLGQNDTRRGEIRDSFNQLMRKATEHGFTVNVWTLCIPCSLSTEETQWWEQWKKKQITKFGISIRLMDENVLQTELGTPDAHHLVDLFFKTPDIHSTVMTQIDEMPIQELPEEIDYSESLFIKKLEDCGITEYNSAKEQFFNAELLAHEITDKGIDHEIKSLISLRKKIHSIWETKYAKAVGTNNFSQLYPDIMEYIENQDKKILSSPAIKASFFHKKGIAHQMANRCEVGWTKDYREVYRKYVETER